MIWYRFKISWFYYTQTQYYMVTKREYKLIPDLEDNLKYDFLDTLVRNYFCIECMNTPHLLLDR